jgi:hypothetical protein
MSAQTTTCQQCGSAAIIERIEGTIRRTASDPLPVIVATIDCPNCGSRQQPQRPAAK